MKTLFAILMFFISFTCFSQTDLIVNYDKIIDFDGKVRKEYNAKGTWYVNQDSVLVQRYGKDSLVYKTLEVKNKRVLYMNDYDEIVEVVFMKKNVTVKNALRPNEYLIFREE